MRVRLTLIAHAETKAMRHGRIAADDGLDARGLAAATAMRAALASIEAHVLVAPEIAARETGEALGFAGEVDAGLRDLDLGGWRGRTLVEIAQAHPSAGRFVEDPRYDAHGGESIEALCRRISGWLDDRRTLAGNFHIVAGPAVLRAALVGAIGAPVSAFWNIEIEPLARLDLVSDGRRWSLRNLANDGRSSGDR